MAKKKDDAPEGFVRTKIDLVRALHISRPTLDEYLTKDGAPSQKNGLWDIEAIALFIGSTKNEKAKSSKSFWEAERHRLMCQKLEHEFAVQRGEFITKAEASKTIVPLMAELAALLKQKFELELSSQYQGKDRVECARLNAEAIDYIIRRFRSGVKDLVEVA